MDEPDYQALGRYTHLCELVTSTTHERAQLLTRAATVLQNAARPRSPGEQAHARACNFTAVERLLTEARAADERLQASIAEANELAPLIDRPELRLG